MIKILFVCHGNICRSTMAQFLFRHLAEKAGYSVTDDIDRTGDFYVDSAATSREEIGNPVDLRTAAKLKEHGIFCGHHLARQITRQDYTAFDLIIIMDKENQWGLQRIIPNDPDRKVHLMMEFAEDNRCKDRTEGFRDVADPWYTHDFEKTYEDLLAGCRGLLDRCGNDIQKRKEGVFL